MTLSDTVPTIKRAIESGALDDDLYDIEYWIRVRRQQAVKDRARAAANAVKVGDTIQFTSIKPKAFMGVMGIVTNVLPDRTATVEVSKWAVSSHWHRYGRIVGDKLVMKVKPGLYEVI